MRPEEFYDPLGLRFTWRPGIVEVVLAVVFTLIACA
jgi:hypothetical protein